MSDYPIGSTAKPYYDIEGNKVTLYRLVREEPDWAKSRIIEGEKAAARVVELEAEVKALQEERGRLKALIRAHISVRDWPKDLSIQDEKG